MKCKFIFGLSSVLLLLLVSSALAYGVGIEAWTDRASYQPGDKGTLHIALKNEESGAVEIYNVTVIFPWYSPIKGGGNVTKDIDEALKAGETYDVQVEFSVPNDGRAEPLYGTASISVMTDSGTYYDSTNVPVALPTTSPATNTLIVILVVIVLVCTGGILAMIYWAMKSITRSQITKPQLP